MIDDKALDTLNNPDLTSEGTARMRAITSGTQAYNIAEKLRNDQNTRNKVEAFIDKKYNGDLPFHPQKLINNQESWRNNFTTGFMPGIIGKVIPVPVGMIDSARYLTSSALSSEVEMGVKKTEFMRDRITHGIRQWDEWKNFQYGLWTEIVLHGCAIAACLDPYSPWPEMYRADRAFIPIGTGQHSKNVPFIALMKDYLVHDFVSFIKDRSVAEEAGWDTDASIKEVEAALPKNRTEANTGDQSRSYEDSIREGNPGSAYSGAKVIQVYHVLATEPDTGKVSHYIVSRNGTHSVLFQKDDRFECMSDVITLFTLEPGNGTYYGSKGMGRMLINMHIACEANRCLLFDQLRMAGLSIIKTDSTKSPTIQMDIRHPFLIVAADGVIEQQPINPNVDSFIAADGQIIRWAEQYAGAYISNLSSGEDINRDRTATESSIDAQREQQARVAFLARAWGQHSGLISLMQCRMIDSETMDEGCKGIQKELVDFGITREEMTEWSESNASEVVQDPTAAQDQKLIQAYAAFKDDQNFDQHKLRDLVATAMVGPQFTKDTLLDDAGLQANDIEAYRQQVVENEAMIAGASVPVSPRDLHEVHLKACMPEIQKGILVVSQSSDPKLMDTINLMLRHCEDGHMKLMSEAGAPPDVLKPYATELSHYENALQSVAKQAQQKQQAGPQDAPGGPLGSLMPQGGPPPQGDPSAQPAPGEDHMIKITSSITYKDAPDDIKRQIEAAAGFIPSKVGAVGNSTLPQANVAVVHNAVAAANDPRMSNPIQHLIPPQAPLAPVKLPAPTAPPPAPSGLVPPSPMVIPPPRVKAPVGL